MTDKRKIIGLWWLPPNTTERWVGTLLLEPKESPQLEVIVPRGFLDPLHQEAPPVIHGHNEHGKPITLLFPGLPGITTSAAISQARFTAGYAVLGMELPDQNAFKVDSLSFRMQHLHEWVGISGFRHEPPSTFHSIHFHYERPADQTFIIDSDLSLELRATYSSTDNWKRKTFEEDTAIAIQSKQGLDLRQCNDLITAFRHLIHFAILKRVYPLTITAAKNDCGDTYGNEFIPREIEVWSSLIRERVESEIQDERWLFKFKDLQANFGTFLTGWFQYVKEYKEALACYFSTIYHRPPHAIEHLSLTQALDAYHGIKFSTHGQHDFERKIFDLAEANKAHLAGLVNDPADFAKTVVHNRNYYTHHNPKWKRDGRVLSDGNLYRLDEKLRLLFQICVLTDMNIPHNRFLRLRRQLATTIIDYV